MLNVFFRFVVLFAIHSILLNGECANLTITVDSFDLKAYESYTKQTYAQAVINGKPTAAGWGNSNIPRTIKDKGESNCCHKGKMGEEQRSSPSNSANTGLSENSLPANQRMGRRVEKILKRVVPKNLEDFRHSPIQSVSIKEAEYRNLHKPDTDQNKLLPPYGQTYGRRNKKSINEDVVFNEVRGGLDVDELNREDLSNIGEIDLDDEEVNSFDDQQDDLRDDNFDSSEAGSDISSQAELKADTDIDEVEIHELFTQEEENTPISEPSLIENTKPLVGKVLSCFHSSSLNHSFKLHALFPASFSAMGFSSGLLGGVQSSIHDKSGCESEASKGKVVEVSFRDERETRDVGTEYTSKKEHNKTLGCLSKELSRLKWGINYDKVSSSKGANRLI
ncbi:uncharacterized protein LOC142519493 [Primulina tabacum]|uniref:uncharacterized protein LOC142519493 n=1 Tax=Primulina tabacum TaxID=48773 RepID=UPI003F595FC5